MWMIGASACVRSLWLFIWLCNRSTGHHEEACNLQPIGFWMKWKCFHEIMTGMGNSFLTTDNKLIILYTRGACISCVLFPKLWSWPSPPPNITKSPSDTTIRHHHQTQLRETAASWFTTVYIPEKEKQHWAFEKTQCAHHTIRHFP